MTEEAKTEVEARIGRAFLGVLLSSGSIGFPEIDALFQGPETFAEAIRGINPELMLFPEVLRNSGADIDLLEVMKDLLPTKLASLLSAKSVEITW